MNLNLKPKMEKTMKYEIIENKHVVDHLTNGDIRYYKTTIAIENENKIKTQLDFIKQQYKIAKRTGIGKLYNDVDSFYLKEKSFDIMIKLYERELELRKNSKRFSTINWSKYKNELEQWDKKKRKSMIETLKIMIMRCENIGWSFVETENFIKNPKKFDVKCVKKCDLEKMLKLIGE